LWRQLCFPTHMGTTVLILRQQGTPRKFAKCGCSEKISNASRTPCKTHTAGEEVV